MNISYIIIDDEPLAHDIIEEYCKDLEFMYLKENCYDALQAMNFLNKEKVDLIFLDLNMPKLKGFDFLRTLENPPKVIVTSAYKEYALEGFDLNVCDYLLKPYSFERFLKAVNKAKSSDQTREIPEQTEGTESEHIFIKGRNKTHQIILNDIIYVEAAGNYTKIICKRDEIISKEKISDIESKFSEKGLLRVHKSFLVQLSYIKEIKSNQIVLSTINIPIGRAYKKHIESFLAK